MKIFEKIIQLSADQTRDDLTGSLYACGIIWRISCSSIIAIDVILNLLGSSSPNSRVMKILEKNQLSADRKWVNLTGSLYACAIF
jgi:hypothetical protein